MSRDQEGENQESTPKSKIKSRREIESSQTQMREPRKPTPSSILVYVVLVVVTLGYALFLPGEPGLAVDQRLAVTIFIRLLLIFLLVNRSWIGWILAVVFESLQIILVALQIEPPGNAKIWGMLFLHTATLALLLTRQTRQHIWHKDPKPVPGAGDRGEATGEQDQSQRNATSSSSSSSSSG